MAPRKKVNQGLPPTLSRKPSMQEIGFTGTVILSGFIMFEEYNIDLKGKRGLEMWDMMRRNDGTIVAALKAVKMPITGADWFLEPASDDPRDMFIRDAVQFMLFEDCETSFFELLRQALNMLDYGFQPFELVYKTTQFQQVKETLPKQSTGTQVPTDQAVDEPVKAGDTPVPLPPPQAVALPKTTYEKPVTLIGLKKIAYRKPLSVYKWIDEQGNPGITQRARDGRMSWIPMDKLVIFTNEREGDNFEGISMLRAMYKHWYIKDTLYKIDAMKAERQGLGVPRVKLPINANASDKAKVEEILQNLRANEAGFLSVPSNFDVEFMDMKGSGTVDMSSSIAHHDRQILLSVLAQFLDFGSHSGSGGARSTSEDHQKLFQQSLEAIAKNFKETVDRYIIQRLVDINWPGSHYPRLRYDKISNADIQQYGTAIGNLAQYGVLTKDKTLEAAVRNELNLPELPDSPEYTQPMDVLPPYIGDMGDNPDNLREEEQTQNIDRGYFPADSGNGEVTVKMSERRRLIARARSAKSAIEKHLENL